MDENLAKQYKKVITNLPDVIKNKLEMNKEFSCEGSDFKSALDKYSDMIAFEYVRYNNYLCTTINIYPYYEDTLLDEVDDEGEEIYINPEIEDDEDGEIFIFSLNFANTDNEPMATPNFEEINGKYHFTGMSGKGVEIQYEVVIEKKDEELALVSRKTLNELPVYEKRIPMTYEELVEYAIVEDEQDLEGLEKDVDDISYEEYIVFDEDEGTDDLEL